jgi:hypothetical protein
MAIGTTGTVEMNGNYVSTIYEDAMFAMEQSMVAGSLSNVQVFDDRADDSSRKGGEYPLLDVEEVGEYDEYESPQQFDITNIATLTPTEKIGQAFLTDKRVRREGPGVRDSIARELGQAMARNIDTTMFAGCANFTGGSLGGTTQTFKWGFILAGAAILREAGYEGPLEALIHDYWLVDLGLAVAPGVSDKHASESYRLNMEGGNGTPGFVGNIAGVDVYVSSRVPAGTTATDAVGGVFAAGALALDRRVDPILEPERNAKARRWELTMHGEWATGSWRAAAGVKIEADKTTPTGS